MRKNWKFLGLFLLAIVALVLLPLTGKGEYRWIKPMEAYVGMMVSPKEIGLSLPGSVGLENGGEIELKWILPLKVKGDFEVRQSRTVPLISWDRCVYDTPILIGEFLLEEYIYGIGSGVLIPYSTWLMKRGLVFWPNQRGALMVWGRLQVPYREANGCEAGVFSDAYSTAPRPAEIKILETVSDLQRLGVGSSALVDRLKALEAKGYKFVVILPGKKVEGSPLNVNVKILSTKEMVADVAPIPVSEGELDGVKFFYLCGFPEARKGVSPLNGTWVSTICGSRYITFTEFLVEGSSIKKTPIIWVRTKEVSPVIKVLLDLDVFFKALWYFVSDSHIGWLLLVFLSLVVILIVRRFLHLPYIPHWKIFLLAFSMLFGPQIFLWTVLRVFKRYRSKKVISERVVSTISFNLLILTMPVILIVNAWVFKWKMPFHTGSIFTSLYALAFFWLLANPKVFSLLKSSGRTFKIVSIVIALLGGLIAGWINPPSLPLGVMASLWMFFLYGWFAYMCLIVWEELGVDFYRFAILSMAIYFFAIICYTDLVIAVRSSLLYSLTKISADGLFDPQNIDLMLRISLRGI